MFHRSTVGLKKKFTVHPSHSYQQRGAKNLAFRPKIPSDMMQQWNFAFNLEAPGRRPKAWNLPETRRLGMHAWPKDVGFYNAGDNFELTPEMGYRLWRHNQAEAFWSQDLNEKAIIGLLPLVESDPAATMPKVQEIFKSHLSRFGADHIIYNVVMQAKAFAKDFEGVKNLFVEMQTLGLEPNAQSFVNVILATQIAGKPKAIAEEYFQKAIASGALTAVMRLDTEFEMWWQQLERMGSFTSGKGYLSNKDEGAVPLPRDPFAIWGWSNDERKFVHPKQAVKAEVNKRTRDGGMAGTVWSNVAREPWFKYRGFKRYDFRGPAPSNYKNVNDQAPRHGWDPYKSAV